ncbi:CHRD domain-containing protein [Sphingomonas oligophenolica]|nr:CHRD domain-containing protein [Sphingomonas oligophenolica]
MTITTKSALLFAAAIGLPLGGCATIAGTVGQTYNTALVGAQEVPGPGDANATGTAKVTADATTNQVCVDLTTQGLAPTAAHIHQGARGIAGPVVLPLETPLDGRSSKCYGVDKQLAAGIIANPAAYYVNVHDAAHPKGAIRGQIGG